MNCGHCPGRLVEHDGMLHCPACGCYFAPSGGLDPNHSACRDAIRQEVPLAAPEDAEAGALVTPATDPDTEDEPAAEADALVTPATDPDTEDESAAGADTADPATPFVNPDVTDIPSERVKGGREGVAAGDAADPEDTAPPERRVRRKA